MAEGFDGRQIPQQSRRNTLRILTTQNHPSCLEPSLDRHLRAGLLPLSDPPSLTSSDWLTCATANTRDFPHHRAASLVPGPSESCRENREIAVKEGVNTIGFVGNLMNSQMDQTQQDYFDLAKTNPIQDINTNPTFYSPTSLQNRRDFDHVYDNDGEMVVYKPEPLSLSLSSFPNYQNGHQLQLNLPRYECGVFSTPSSVPLGPFIGYASVLKGSRFLRPAQQLLEEFCGIWCPGNFNQKMEVDSGLMDSQSEALRFLVDDPLRSGCDGGEIRRKKSRLVSMIDEVCRRYKQYYQQMQEVMASFECVSGLGNASPYANLAVKAMSKHFRCLKNTILDQLQFTTKPQINFSQNHIQNSGFLDQQPTWRPQRGLPERAVTVLRAWLFEHFLHPYPSDTDKLMLAKQTGLSRSQVSNWFINARVRLWKPMVEDMHTLETGQGQRTVATTEDRNFDHSLSDKSSLLIRDNSSKLPRNDSLRDVPLHPTYNNLSSHVPRVDLNSTIGGGFRGNVSLTLGLHQNNVVQRYGFGPEDSNPGDGAFDAQSRHFGRDMIGGQLVHDFVD